MRQQRGRKIKVGSVRVTLYARHKATCSQKADNSGNVACDCIRWMQFASGKRESTNEWRWAAAEKVARERAAQLAGIAVGEVPVAKSASVTVKQASEQWIADRAQNNLTNGRPKRMMRNLLDWCQVQGIENLSDVTKATLLRWRGTWKYRSGDSASLKVAWCCVGSFFDWCVGADLLAVNPFPRGPQFKVKVRQREVVPYSQKQIDTLLASIEKVKGWDDALRVRMRAFILLMRWSGMATGDALCLERSRLVNSRIRSRRKKVDKAFYIRIPAFVADLLNSLECDDPKYFFWHRRQDGGKFQRGSLVSEYDFYFSELCAEAGIKGIAYQLRHSFATHLLALGTRIEDVARMLGHSVRECQKTYQHRIKEEEDRLDEVMETNWQKMGLDADGNPTGRRSAVQ